MKYKVFKVVEEIHYLIVDADSEENAEKLAEEQINSVDWLFCGKQNNEILNGQTELQDDN